MFNWIKKYFRTSYNLGKALPPRPLSTKQLTKEDLDAWENLFKNKIRDNGNDKKN